MKITTFLKIFLPLLILLSLVYFLWQGLSINPRLVPSVLINQQTPEFNLPELKNPKSHLSNKVFLGHVSLLNVWASWCATCLNEYPTLIEIAQTHLVKIYGLDYKDKRNAALNWLKQYGDPFTAIGFDKAGTVAINWGVYGTPETFVIDKHGIIRYKQIGAITPKIWQKKLLPMILSLKKEH